MGVQKVTLIFPLICLASKRGPNLVERLNKTCQEKYYLRHFNELSNNFDSLRTFIKQNHYNYSKFSLTILPATSSDDQYLTIFLLSLFLTHISLSTNFL